VVVMKKNSVLIKLYLIVILSSLLLSIILPTTSAMSIDQNPGLPTVTVSLIDTVKTAHVGPGSDGTVEFNGTVTVSMNPATSVVVSLSAEDTWGSAEVSPSEMLFSKSGEQSFTVKVDARPRESTQTTGTVTVTGRWRLYPGTLGGSAEPPEGATGRINIAQFYKFTLKSPKAFIETSLDSEVEFTLIIQNRGNGIDVFSIGINNMDKMDEKDITVSLSQVTAQILENPTEHSIELRVTIPKDSKCIGYHTIKAGVTSEGGGIQQMLRFVIRIPDEEVLYTTEFSTLIIIIILVIILCIAFFWHRRRKRRRKS
jgi:hypothetical protein